MLRNLIASTFYRATAMRFEAPRTISRKWLELTAMRRFLAEYRINLIVDVGANEGQFAAKLRRLGYSGHIVSFEPDPRAYALLAARHAGDRKWRGFPIALGEAESTMQFNLATNTVLSSFLTSIRSDNPSGRVSVNVRRLDQIWSALVSEIPDPRVLLKTDTQGFDLHVLRGASGCVGQISGVLAELSVLPIYEQSPPFDESIRAYKNAGFDIIDLSIVNRTPDGRVLEFDGLFVRRPTERDAQAADAVSID